MSSQEVSATTLTQTCLCHAISYKPVFKHKTLPLPAEFCHCDTCRRTSGAIAGAFVELAEAPSSEILSQCTEYNSSEKVGRYFCSRCGSHVFLRGWSEEHPTLWFLWAGCLERADDDDRKDVDTIKVTMQCYVKDTMDGGLVGRMAEVVTQKKASDGHSEDNVSKDSPMAAVYPDIWVGTKMTNSDIHALAAESRMRTQTADRLYAECHCGSVKFCVTRPAPIESYSDKAKSRITDDNTKFLAGFCLCRSCRSSTGNPLHSWTWIPPKNIVTTTGEPVDFFGGDAGLKKLGPAVKKYKSSPAVTWYFCGTCGASIFYEAADRDWVIDISIGILRSQVGALASDFLMWEWEMDNRVEECTVRKLSESVSG